MKIALWTISALIVLSLLQSAMPVTANPILFVPTGNMLTTGQFRAEAAFSPNNENGKYFWLGAGLLQFEANLIRFESPTGEKENLIGAQWNFLPETLLTPGISFGVKDIASESEEGIGGYLAITKHIPIGEAVSLVKDFSATVGVGVGGIKGLFAGFEAKLPLGFFVQGEYDSHDLNAAAGWQPINMFRVKAYSLRKEFFFGAELVPILF
jgi:hypothetical protein